MGETRQKIVAGGMITMMMVSEWDGMIEWKGEEDEP
jgi:hypothetical protein